ncbi:MAG: hypothetical protein WBO45_09310, partial [Planctomycetota bacterium]
MRPTPRCLWLFGGGLPVAALPTLAAWPEAWVAWLAYVAAGGLAVAAELLLLPTPRTTRLRVLPPGVVHFGDAAAVLLEGESTRPVVVDVEVELRGDVEPLP